MNVSDAVLNTPHPIAMSCDSVLPITSHLNVPSAPIGQHSSSPFLSYDLQCPIFAAQPVSPDVLNIWLSDNDQSHSMLVIDCRVFVSYNLSHIKSALNVHCPSIVRRRIRGAGMPLEYVVPCMSQRNRLQAGDIRKVVLYDQDCKIPAIVSNRPISVGSSIGASESTLVLVMRSLTQVISPDSLYFLQGGF